MLHMAPFTTIGQFVRPRNRL